MASSSQTPHNALRLIEKEMRKDAQHRGYNKLSAEIEDALDLLWNVVILGHAEAVDDRDEVTS